MSQGDRIERLLALARDELGPAESDQARSRHALGLPSKPSAIVRIGRAPHSARSWNALSASGNAGLMAGALLLGAGFAAGYWMGQGVTGVRAEASDLLQGKSEALLLPRESAIVPVQADAVSEPASGAITTSFPAPHVTAAAPSTPALHRAAKGSARPAPVTAAAGDELSLLRRVERALRAEDSALALVLIAELEQRFPNTDLAEERAAATVLAQCGAAGSGARQLAENYLLEKPTSVYSERIRERCTFEDTAATVSEGSRAAGHE